PALHPAPGSRVRRSQSLLPVSKFVRPSLALLLVLALLSPYVLLKIFNRIGVIRVIRGFVRVFRGTDLTKRQVQRMTARIKEVDLKRLIVYSTFLQDELIKARFSNLAGAVGSGIRPVTVAWRAAVQCNFKANGLTGFCRS